MIRLPTGIWYAPRVKANVHFTLKQNPRSRADLDDFVRSYLSGKDRAERVESERWRSQ